jgi:hypothetical protein
MVNILYTTPGKYDAIYFSSNKWKISYINVDDLELFNRIVENNKIYYLRKQTDNISNYLQNLVDGLNKTGGESIW